VDLASISPIASLTGGDIHLFNPFYATTHGEKLHYEIFRTLTRNQGNEVVIKARTSAGISITEYFGSFSIKETVDFELAAIDADKCIGFTIRNDDKLKENELAGIQFAMLYTTQFGDRRIRVFNINL